VQFLFGIGRGWRGKRHDCWQEALTLTLMLILFVNTALSVLCETEQKGTRVAQVESERMQR
jgi:hypothetical protein